MDFLFYIFFSQETLYHGSLGKAENPPKIERGVSGVKLVYTNGDDCEVDGKKQKFRTIVHFTCAKGMMVGTVGGENRNSFLLL